MPFPVIPVLIASAAALVYRGFKENPQGGEPKASTAPKKAPSEVKPKPKPKAPQKAEPKASPKVTRKRSPKPKAENKEEKAEPEEQKVVDAPKEEKDNQD